MKRCLDFIGGSIREEEQQIAQYETLCTTNDPDCPPNVLEILEEMKAALNTHRHEYLTAYRKLQVLKTLFCSELRNSITNTDTCPIENSEEFQKTYDTLVRDRAMKEQTENKLVMLEHVTHDKCTD